MASQQLQLVCDQSTLANFKAWAQPISAWFATCGWTQSSDTGQVNWSSIASVPGSGAYVYEVWQPNDGLTNFYVKMEYGNFSGQTNCPEIRITISTTTNGAGTATGYILGPILVNPSSFTPASTTTQYECNFSGALSRICVMMWRNGTVANSMFAIERSLNSSGVYTGSYVTLWTCGVSAFSAGGFQQTLVFGVGVGPAGLNASNNSTQGWVLRVPPFTNNATSAFNGKIPMDLAAPFIGYFDYPCTVAGGALKTDLIEGVTFQATVYGTTITYMPSHTGSFPYVVNGNIATLIMRYD